MPRLNSLVAVIFAVIVSVSAKAQGPIRLVHAAGLRISAQQASLPDWLVKGMAQEGIPSAWLISGNATASGRSGEFENAAKLLVAHRPAACPGPSDLASPSALASEINQLFPKRYQSLDFGDLHVVLLDSTIRGSDTGFLSSPQLKWLEGDLKKLKKDRPILVVMHHLVGSVTPFDLANEDSLLRVLAPYRVAAIFGSAGGEERAWKVNGIRCFATRGVNHGGADLITLNEDTITVQRLRKGTSPGLLNVASYLVPKAEFKRVAFLWDDPDVPLLARRRPLAELRVGPKGLAQDEKVTARYAIDERAPVDMQRDKRDEKSVSFMAQFETKDLGVGEHRLRLLLTDPDDGVFQRDERFVYEDLRGQPRKRWETEPGDSPVIFVGVSGDLVIGATQSGKVSAYSQADGKRRWSVSLGELVSASKSSTDQMICSQLSGEQVVLQASNGSRGPTPNGDGRADNAVAVPQAKARLVVGWSPGTSAGGLNYQLGAPICVLEWAGTTAFVGCADGRLIAISPPVTRDRAKIQMPP